MKATFKECRFSCLLGFGNDKLEAAVIKTQEAFKVSDKIKVSEQEVQWFKKELGIYIGVVLAPLNLICIAIIFMKGIPFFIPILIAGGLDYYFYKQIKQTFVDIANNDFIKRRGLLKRKMWGFNLNKFEYVLKDEPESFSSFISRFNSLDDHEVTVVYTKNSKKILKMWKV